MSEGKIDKNSDLTPTQQLIAGGFAGAVSRSVVSPLERLKILYQVQGNDQKYKGIFRSLVTIGKEEGFYGYFKGNGANVARIIPYSAVQFLSYEQLEKLMGLQEKKDMDMVTRFLCGAIAGVNSVALTYPMDLVRTRLTVQAGHVKHGMWTVTKQVVKLEGILGLYKGFVPTVAGIAPYVGLNFMAYDMLKVLFQDRVNGPQGIEAVTIVDRLACGALAGAIAQTVTYPLDVLRRRMQMQGVSPAFPIYGTTRRCITMMIRDEGITSLYKGLLPNYLKVVPSVSVSFVTFDILRHYFTGKW